MILEHFPHCRKKPQTHWQPLPSPSPAPGHRTSASCLWLCSSGRQHSHGRDLTTAAQLLCQGPVPCLHKGSLAGTRRSARPTLCPCNSRFSCHPVKRLFTSPVTRAGHPSWDFPLCPLPGLLLGPFWETRGTAWVVIAAGFPTVPKAVQAYDP